MRNLIGLRTQILTSAEQVDAVFTSPALYRLAALVTTGKTVGRPAQHPTWSLLAYGVLARVFRSGARVEAELSEGDTWQRILTVVAAVRAAHPELDIPAAGSRPPKWDAWKHMRNEYFTDPDILAALQRGFTEIAVEQARSLGLLDPAGAGSLCHPDRTRVVYGDGTVIRPLYRPPNATRTVDATTGEVSVTYLDGAGKPIPAPTRRFDPDAADYHGHAGPVHGQNYVALYVRGHAPHQRIVLAVDRVCKPGLEAETAVRAFQQLHQVAGAGIQALVYDGAMRGVHIDELMTGCGVLVINKVHASAKTARRKGKITTPRWFALGTWEHDLAGGATCTHQLAALDGAVHEIGVADDGQPVVLSRLERKQVKRPRRGTGRFHFNVGYHVPCAGGGFLAWVTPHGDPTDTDHRRADTIRVIAEGEPDFDRLYPVRSDAESFNSQLKRSLLVDRAMTLGGKRQLLDVLCFGLLNNAITAHHHALAEATAQHTTWLRLAA